MTTWCTRYAVGRARASREPLSTTPTSCRRRPNPWGYRGQSRPRSARVGQAAYARKGRPRHCALTVDTSSPLEHLKVLRKRSSVVCAERPGRRASPAPMSAWATPYAGVKWGNYDASYRGTGCARSRANPDEDWNALLVEEAVDTVRVAKHLHGPTADVRKDAVSVVEVVADEVALRQAGLGEEDLVEVRELDVSPADPHRHKPTEPCRQIPLRGDGSRLDRRALSVCRLPSHNPPASGESPVSDLRLHTPRSGPRHLTGGLGAPRSLLPWPSTEKWPSG
jgi:hypothetical protein